jgi:CRISPR-associated protein (TIGR03984 family)
MTADETIQLYQLKLDDVRPEDILCRLKKSDLAEGLAFVMLMGRRRFELARVDAAGVLHVANGATRLEDAYEIRVFGLETDAHWQRTGADAGRLSVLTIKAPSGENKGSTIQATASLCRHYRMFGKTEATDAKDWCQLTSPRVAPIPVPIEAKAKESLQLDAVEHIARFKHGNAAVIAERLTGISVVLKTERQKDRDDGQ